jgi:hypothetical protein
MREMMSRRSRLIGVCVLACCACCITPVGAFGLSEGRVYELVSPIYKGGYAANSITAVAPNGESVAFTSLGAFAGDPSNPAADNFYIARRGASEWSTAPLQQPAAVSPRGGLIDYSATLESSLSEGSPGSSYFTSSYEGTEFEFLLHSTDAPDTAPNAPEPGPNFEVAGSVMETLAKKIGWNGSEADASPDFSHIVFSVDEGLELLSEAAKTESDLYDIASHPAAGEPPLRLVGLNNKHKALEPECHVTLGAGRGKDSRLNAVADDGGEIFFTPTISKKSNECTRHEQVFVRLGGSKALEVSRPLLPLCAEVPCGLEAETRAPAQFAGANEAGTKVFFTIAQPLLPGSTDASNNLYMATIGCAASEPACEAAKREVTSLVQVSQAPSATEAAEVQNVVTIAPDGSRVYFVARGVLDTVQNADGQAPVKGADNLYVYDSVSAGSPVFIGDLCSAPETSGVVEDPRCPSGLNTTEGPGAKNDTSLWVTNEPEAQVNSCSGADPTCEPGRFLVFSAYAQLSPDDTDDAKDVYRYDAQTGSLQRVSVGEDGYDANGNRDGSDATIARNHEAGKVYEQQDLISRAISEAGSQIVFTTIEPLSEGAINHLADVYEWHEGSVSLVSTGSSSESTEDVVISDTGNDVFFVTSQGLAPQDTDGQRDVYDARLHGGFPPQAAQPRACEDEACQGPLTNPAPLLVPGSVSQAPGGNFVALPAPTKATAPKKKATPKCAKGELNHGKCVKAKAKAKKSTKAKRAGDGRGGRS